VPSTSVYRSIFFIWYENIAAVVRFEQIIPENISKIYLSVHIKRQDLDNMCDKNIEKMSNKPTKRVKWWSTTKSWVQIKFNLNYTLNNSFKFVFETIHWHHHYQHGSRMWLTVICQTKLLRKLQKCKISNGCVQSSSVSLAYRATSVPQFVQTPPTSVHPYTTLFTT